MKYSFTLDVCLTVFIWGLLGWSIVGFMIAVVVGTIGSIKFTTAWHRMGGLRAILGATGRSLLRGLRRLIRRRAV